MMTAGVPAAANCASRTSLQAHSVADEFLGIPGSRPDSSCAIKGADAFNRAWVWHIAKLGAIRGQRLGFSVVACADVYADRPRSGRARPGIFRAGKSPYYRRGARSIFSSVPGGRQPNGVRDLVILVERAVGWYEEHLGSYSLDREFAPPLNHLHEPGMLIAQRGSY